MAKALKSKAKPRKKSGRVSKKTAAALASEAQHPDMAISVFTKIL
jgi:hypothetical protein